VASVASFFVSRIDSLLDPQLEKLSARRGKEADIAKSAQGQVAIASAKMAYQIYKGIFASDSSQSRGEPASFARRAPSREGMGTLSGFPCQRFGKLAAHGARVQRLLWASTSTKNPNYRDVKYVEALIGPDTVNTAPLETIDAYRDHGRPDARLEQGVEEARRVLGGLAELGINIDTVTQQLEDDGVDKFNKPFDKLMETLAQRSQREA